MSPDQHMPEISKAQQREIQDVVNGFLIVAEDLQRQIDSAKTQTKRKYYEKKLKKLMTKMGLST